MGCNFYFQLDTQCWQWGEGSCFSRPACFCVSLLLSGWVCVLASWAGCKKYGHNPGTEPATHQQHIAYLPSDGFMLFCARLCVNCAAGGWGGLGLGMKWVLPFLLIISNIYISPERKRQSLGLVCA